METQILIVDDNVKLCRSLVQNFDQLGYTCHYALNSKTALDIYRSETITAVILDVVLGDEDGLEVLKALLNLNPQLPVVMVTGYGSIETAVTSVKCGAFDYVQKPLDFNKLLNIVENGIRLVSLQKDNTALKNRIVEMSDPIVTQNEGMFELCEKAAKLAETELPVLIVGENGTGKELLANFVHNNSNRNTQKLCSINCAALPESLLDNELFGHEKGAYTGADSVYSGIFERADNSTLHLDEIGDMNTATQAKILRALQNKEIRRIGGKDTIEVNVRFIASTNKDLSALIDEKLFRKDLFYRLNAATLTVPPLRARLDDLPLLIDHFLGIVSDSTNQPAPHLSDEVFRRFIEHQWPGNIRELKNTINYAATLCSSGQIRIKDLPAAFIKPRNDTSGLSLMEENEKMLILKMLNQSGFNKKRAADLLNISRKTLYNKLKKYGIMESHRENG